MTMERLFSSDTLTPVGKLFDSVLFPVFLFWGYTMSVRTYNPSVLIGNWNEDICVEEVSMFEYSLKCCWVQACCVFKFMWTLDGCFGKLKFAFSFYSFRTNLRIFSRKKKRENSWFKKQAISFKVYLKRSVKYSDRGRGEGVVLCKCLGEGVPLGQWNPYPTPAHVHLHLARLYSKNPYPQVNFYSWLNSSSLSSVSQ